MNDCITTTKQSTSKPCAYFLGYTVSVNNQWGGRNCHRDSEVYLKMWIENHRCSVRHTISTMVSLNRNIFPVIGTLWGESTGHQWLPLTKSSDGKVFLDLRPNKRLRRHSRRGCVEAPSRSLWCHCYDNTNYIRSMAIGIFIESMI